MIRNSAVVLLILAGIFTAPDALAYSGGVTGKTNKTGGSGCTSCHGASADSAMTVAISGPTALMPGETGTYTITNSKAGVNGQPMGIDIAASDAASLSVVTGQPTQLASGEITHSINVGALRTVSGGSGSYQFKYTMPAAAAIGSTHTLYGVSVIDYGGGWKHAPNFTVTAVAPAAPTSLTATAQSSSSIALTWAGTSPEFRVIRKLVSSPSSPTDGTLVYEGTGTSTTATGLAASTQYFFAAYGKASGSALYSTTAALANATTNSATIVTRYVDAATGNDNAGANNCTTQASPCKTVTRAMSAASTGNPGDTISVAPGTYNMALGEVFPITVKSGVTLKSTGGPEATIIDATGANMRVLYCSANAASTLIEGFTIRSGFAQPAADGSVAKGGGLLAENTDNTTIRGNVFMNNEARGYNGTGSTFVSGGQAYGGAIYVASGAVNIVNNVFSGNTARGGNGIDRFGLTTTGGSGGSGTGGGVYVQGTGTVINNTFYGNLAVGGNGGFSLGQGGTAGDGSYGGAGSFGPTIANNVFMGNTAAGGTGGGGSPPGSNGFSSYGSFYDGGGNASTSPKNNLVFGSTQTGFSHYPNGTGTNEVEADPRLHSPSNWRLRYTSPAIGAGTATGAPTTDLDGVTRPNPPAIGAFEASTLTPASSGTIAGSTGSTVAVGSTGVSVNFSTFSGGDVIAEHYASGRTGSVPTANASAYFWTVATTASSLSGTATFDFTGKGVGNPSTVKLLRRSGSGRPWAELTTGVTRSGNTISTSVTGFSDFALGDIQAASTTIVVASPSPADAGHPITFTATVTGTGGTPTGTVTLSEGGTTLGSASLASGAASVTTSGCSENALTCVHAGSHTITATYAGDANFGGSSGSVGLTVNKDSTTTTLASSSSTVTVGSPITLTATVFCHSGSPYGTVVFKDGTTALGTANVTNTLASLTTSTLGVGTHSLTAEYAGSADFLPSASGALSVTVNAGTGTSTLSIGDVTLSEGNSGTSSASFTVTLANPGSQTVTVNFATADGTATAGSDYQASSGTLSFPSGTTAQTISVTVNGDTTVEANETFSVALSSPTNASLARATATGTISNDDSTSATPTLSIDDRSVTEGSATAAGFRVVLSAASTQNVTVDYATADAAANAGSDYSSTSGTLTFTPGRTQHTIVVPILSDSTSEGIETFFVNLSNPTNATLADGQAMGTISNPPTAQHVPMYRAYNKSTDYHFFTTDLNSKNFAVNTLGFQDESTPPPFYVSNVQLTDMIPLFRMYNPNLGRHYYTGGVSNRDFLMSIGMVYEKDEGFIYPIEGGVQIAGTTELYRLYNNNSGTHLFTADAAQKDGILTLFAGVWVQHTSVGIVFTSP